MQKVAQDVTYASTGGAFFGWLYQQDWLLIISAFCSVVGLIFTVYFKYKEDKRKQTEFELRLSREFGIYNQKQLEACENRKAEQGGQNAARD